MLLINIAKEYSETPGPRLIIEGDGSGEDFRNKLLKPKFDEAIRNEEVLIVNLDGTYGYGTSFLEEAFGGLARIYNNVEIVNNNIKLISEDNPELIIKIKAYINEALEK